jgi:16S rRNA (uracil1498-N3)-methyltransferase
VTRERGPADVPAAAHVFVGRLDDRCEISGDDGHHLQRVRRLGPGEIVTAADGTGAWRTYEIAAASDGRLTLDACDDVRVETRSAVGVALAVALTKTGLEPVVSAATELGVQSVTPLRTARAVVRWDARRAERSVERLRTVARKASMQSRRATVPSIGGVTDLGALATALDPSSLVVAARDGGSARELPVPAPERGGEAGAWTVVVGPEGGLAPEELDALPGARLRLGRNVLRAVTAPVAAVAVLVAEAERRCATPRDRG